MKAKQFTIETKLDAAGFRSFAVFDNWFRRARWLTVAGFGVLMLVFAAMCFVAETMPVGWIILATGVILPAVYIVNFLLSVQGQIKRYDLSAKRTVYTVTLADTAKGVCVSNGQGERATYYWEDCMGAWRVKGYIYLYALRGRAFILPEACMADTEAVWALIQKRMPEKRLHSARRLTQKVRQKEICA